jgi:hypothetical protein
MATTPSHRRLVRAAFASAKRAHALSLRRRGATYAAIGAELGVCLEQARQAVLKAERLIERPRWFDALPTRVRRFLRDRGLADLPEAAAAEALARLTVKELKETPNLGKGALAAIEAWLERLGLTLRDIETNPDATKPASRAGFAECKPVADAATPIVQQTEQFVVPRRAMVRNHGRLPVPPGPEDENLTPMRCPDGRRKFQYT